MLRPRGAAARGWRGSTGILGLGTVGGRCTRGSSGRVSEGPGGKAARRWRTALPRDAVVAPRLPVVGLPSCERGHLGAGGVTAVLDGAWGRAPLSPSGPGPRAHHPGGRGAPRNPGPAGEARPAPRPAPRPPVLTAPVWDSDQADRAGRGRRGGPGLGRTRGCGTPPGARCGVCDAPHLPAGLARSARAGGRGGSGYVESRGAGEGPRGAGRALGAGCRGRSPRGRARAVRMPVLA